MYPSFICPLLKGGRGGDKRERKRESPFPSSKNKKIAQTKLNSEETRPPWKCNNVDKVWCRDGERWRCACRSNEGLYRHQCNKSIKLERPNPPFNRFQSHEPIGGGSARRRSVGGAGLASFLFERHRTLHDAWPQAAGPHTVYRRVSIKILLVLLAIILMYFRPQKKSQTNY